MLKTAFKFEQLLVNTNVPFKSQEAPVYSQKMSVKRLNFGEKKKALSSQVRCENPIFLNSA
jgi:hypothetical protein